MPTIVEQIIALERAIASAHGRMDIVDDDMKAFRALKQAEIERNDQSLSALYATQEGRAYLKAKCGTIGKPGRTMRQMQFDVQDGLAPVTFSVQEQDAERLQAFMDANQRRQEAGLPSLYGWIALEKEKPEDGRRIWLRPRCSDQAMPAALSWNGEKAVSAVQTWRVSEQSGMLMQEGAGEIIDIKMFSYWKPRL